jgi:2-polyprenyl-3-methyl-5-hydroxy-6-metoxy-1,4-benzoquinol methylase
MNSSCDRYRSPETGSILNYENNDLIDSKDNRFPIINNIPRFVPIDNYSSSFGFQWNIFNQTQVDFYNKSNISSKKFYESTKWNKEQLNGKLILEVGSGSGRFTQVILETGANLYSLDYSTAVEANAKNNSNYSNLNLCQASVYQLPFEKNYFDFICCLGVIQHTPDVELSFSKMLDHLKPGGK